MDEDLIGRFCFGPSLGQGLCSDVRSEQLPEMVGTEDDTHTDSLPCAHYTNSP